MIWSDAEQRLWQSIVDGLRRQGWDRFDAMEEADLKMSRIFSENERSTNEARNVTTEVTTAVPDQ